MSRPLFHLAFPSTDIEATKQFYVDGLGCTLGRETKQAATLEFAGYQIVAHVTTAPIEPPTSIYPRHFGLIFSEEEDWRALADRAKAKGLRFYQEPKRRFPGTRAEHGTFFLEDPAHNLLEFKWYKYESAIFGERDFSQVGDARENNDAL